MGDINRTLVIGFLSILKVLKRASFKLTDLKKLKAKNSTNDCIILGNGPSLRTSIKQFDEGNFLNGKEIIVLNNFVSSENYEKYKPSYYVFADPGFWEEETLERIVVLRERIFCLLDEKTTWPINILFPYSAKDSSVLQTIKNKNIKIYFFNNIEINKGPRRLNFFLYKKNLAMPVNQTVLISAIYIAINTGFKNIYLFGADHSWHEDIVIDKNNRVYIYNKQFNAANDETQLVPCQYPNGSYQKIYNLFNDSAQAFFNHDILEEYSKYIGMKIYNASAKSFIDSYERFDIQ